MPMSNLLYHKDLTDAQWNRIKDLFPEEKKVGRRPLNSRKVFDDILWILKSGARWRDLPPCYGNPEQHLSQIPPVVWRRRFRDHPESFDQRDRQIWQSLFTILNALLSFWAKWNSPAKRFLATKLFFQLELVNIFKRKVARSAFPIRPIHS